MKDRTTISACALLASLGAYYYAKASKKDTTPLVMMGGFVGAIIGELVLDASKTQQNTVKKQIQKK